MKKILLPLVISIGLMSQSFATCQKDYQDEVSRRRLSTSISLGNGGPQSQGMTHVVFYGSTAFGPLGLAIAGGGLALLGGTILADYLLDRPNRKMIRVLDESNYMVNGYPEMRTDFEEKVVIPKEVSKSEKKRLKKQNKRAKKHNKALRRINKRLAKALKKSKKAFNKLYSVVDTKSPIEKEEFAKLVNQANQDNLMCNGTIGLYFDKPLPKRRTDYVEVNAKTRMKRWKQRRHNKKVRKHNRKISKIEYKNSLAKYSEVSKYFQVVR